MKKLLSFFIVAASLTVLLASSVSCSGNEDSTLKVISYNIRYGAADDGDNSWEFRRPASIAMLQEQDPEIFGLQEEDRKEQKTTKIGKKQTSSSQDFGYNSDDVFGGF